MTYSLGAGTILPPGEFYSNKENYSALDDLKVSFIHLFYSKKMCYNLPAECSEGGTQMIFQLSEEDIRKVCSQCSHFNEEQCQQQAKLIDDVRRCTEWDAHYGEKCVRKRSGLK